MQARKRDVNKLISKYMFVGITLPGIYRNNNHV